MRLLVHSTATGRFLVPSLEGGEPTWERSLKKAGGGVVADFESALQLVMDNTEIEDGPEIVDLDRLGTSVDY